MTEDPTPMLPGPVFHVELLTTARRSRYYFVRFLYGLILLFFIWRRDPRFWYGVSSYANGLTFRDLAELGQSIFITFVVVQTLAVLLLTPSLVAGTIAEEKQRKTLHYLLASRLSGAEIVLGKLAARMIHVGVFVGIGLPILSLTTLFGGLDPMFVPLAFAATVTMAFFLAGLAILVSVHARRPREAISLAYLLTFFWLLVPPMIPLLMPAGGPFWVQVYDWIKPINDWIAVTSPFTLVIGGLPLGPRGGVFRPATAFWMMGLQVLYGALFVTLAVLRLRPASRGGGGTGQGFARLRRLVRRGRIFPRPPCGDDAMMWKERYVSRTGIATKVIAGFVVLLAGCALGSLTYDYARPAFEELATFGYGTSGTSKSRDEFNVFLRFFCTSLYILWALGLASASSSGLSSEREEDTWTSLIATPLEASEIIRAKMFGAFWGVRWAGMVLVSLWLLGLAAGSLHPFGFLALVIETTVYLWFVCALGTYLSLRSSTSGRALVTTIAVLFVVNGAYLFCCFTVVSDTTLVALGVTPMVEALSLVSYDDVRAYLSGQFGRYGFSPYRYRRDVVATCFLSVLGYIIAASILTHRALSRFEAEADRPRRPVPLRRELPLDIDEDEGGKKAQGPDGRGASGGEE